MSTTTFDPTGTATSLASAYIAGRQQLLKTQIDRATAATAALDKLQQALAAFATAVRGLAGSSGVLTQSAKFNDPSIGSATASASAAAGSYSFFVKQLATANQKVYAGLATVPTPAPGRDVLVVNLAGGASIQVNLSAADRNGDGLLTPAETAAAINSAADNGSKVTASIVTVGGQSQMVLSANATGAGSAISLDTSGLDAGALASALDAGSDVVAAQDAIVFLGAENSGVPMQQASNTFAAIDGVQITFTKAMDPGSAPATLTVVSDSTATATKLQGFVDAYNKLNDLLKALTNAGDPKTKTAAGAFADDSAVRALRSRLNSVLREKTGGVTLANYGVSADRYGVLSLDASRMTTMLASNPTGLDTLLGQTGVGVSSGVLGALDTTLNLWTSGSSGQIKHRQDGLTKLQTSFSERQATLDTQYNNAYARYLAQFTKLATLQDQMSHTTNLFDALFSNSSDS